MVVLAILDVQSSFFLVTWAKDIYEHYWVRRYWYTQAPPWLFCADCPYTNQAHTKQQPGVRHVSTTITRRLFMSADSCIKMQDVHVMSYYLIYTRRSQSTVLHGQWSSYAEESNTGGTANPDQRVTLHCLAPCRHSHAKNSYVLKNECVLLRSIVTDLNRMHPPFGRRQQNSLRPDQFLQQTHY